MLCLKPCFEGIRATTYIVPQQQVDLSPYQDVALLKLRLVFRFINSNIV